MRIRARIDPEDIPRYLGSIRVIEGQVEGLSVDDAKQLANEAVQFIRDRFPKSKGKRQALIKGEIVAKGPPLAGGWRKYPSATKDGSGFTIRHVRAGNDRVRTVLASIDQGSRSFVMRLKRARAFAFLQNGRVVIRNNDGTGKGKWTVEKRPPFPDRQGYIRPTFEFIKQRVNEMVAARKAAMETRRQKHELRGTMLRQRLIAVKVRKLAEE